jgi:hypothetical protein
MGSSPLIRYFKIKKSMGIKKNQIVLIVIAAILSSKLCGQHQIIVPIEDAIMVYQDSVPIEDQILLSRIDSVNTSALK